MTDTITLPRSVVERALEALDEIAWSNNTRWQSDRADDARIVLRAALEQPQSMTDCHQSQPKGGQEPVAWMHQCRKKPELVKLSFKKREPALAASGYKARPLIFGDTAKPRQPLTDEQQIAEAMRRHGLVLVKTVNGYDVLKLGQITAHGIGGEK